jgi:hypothetical protein
MINIEEKILVRNVLNIYIYIYVQSSYCQFHAVGNVVVLQNSVDLPNDEQGSCSEMSVTSTHDRHELTFIKVEEVEEDPEVVTGVIIRTEPEVSCIFQC